MLPSQGKRNKSCDACRKRKVRCVVVRHPGAPCTLCEVGSKEFAILSVAVSGSSRVKGLSGQLAVVMPKRPLTPLPRLCCCVRPMQRTGSTCTFSLRQQRKQQVSASFSITPCSQPWPDAHSFNHCLSKGACGSTRLRRLLSQAAFNRNLEFIIFRARWPPTRVQDTAM